MFALRACALAAGLAPLSPGAAWAQKGGSHGGGSHAATAPHAATVHVKGYTRADGTHVDGYDRRAPGSSGRAQPSLAEIARALTCPTFQLQPWSATTLPVISTRPPTSA
jgi:hypothetical protein